jgi:hypothetical protein
MLQRVLAHEKTLTAIEPDAWRCGWLSPLDLIVLYGLIADAAPRHYVEVGSGCSTQFAHRAIADQGLATTILSIDPEPRDDIDKLCHEVIRLPLEGADLAVFERLGPGDVLFVDGSHRCFTNSDVTVFFLEILPALAPGVRVGIDDIYLPWDYPGEWSDRFYSEQYLLAAWLLGGAAVDILAPNAFISRDDELSSVVRPLRDALPLADLPTDGNSFWFEISA